MFCIEQKNGNVIWKFVRFFSYRSPIIIRLTTFLCLIFEMRGEKSRRLISKIGRVWVYQNWKTETKKWCTCALHLDGTVTHAHTHSNTHTYRLISLSRFSLSISLWHTHTLTHIHIHSHTFYFCWHARLRNRRSGEREGERDNFQVAGISHFFFLLLNLRFLNLVRCCCWVAALLYGHSSCA